MKPDYLYEVATVSVVPRASHSFQRSLLFLFKVNMIWVTMDTTGQTSSWSPLTDLYIPEVTGI